MTDESRVESIINKCVECNFYDCRQCEICNSDVVAIGHIYNDYLVQKEILKKIRDELVGDRMEQFDDYVIYLQTKYLKILGEDEE